MKRLSPAITLAAIAASATAAAVAFTGSNDEVNAPVGAFNIAGNRAGDVLPSGSSIGLVTTTANVTTGTYWQNLAVCQTGRIRLF
ncbi:MAG: hypothetical protein RLZZ214_4300 [Verrucomicrobiota bacterium]